MKRNNKTFAAICSVLAIISIVIAIYPDEIRTGEAGLKLIGDFESCRNEPYHCPADILTVGIGSTSAGGKPIERDKRYSNEEIAARWVDDIKQAENCVNRYANGESLPQETFEAITSITFNVGCGTMQKSTLYRYARQGNIKKACDEFPRWKYSGGKVLQGLINRRIAERELCLMSI